MKYLLMIILLFSSNQAAAEGFVSGSFLLEGCEAYLSKTSAAEGNTCFGFVTGVSDAYSNFLKVMEYPGSGVFLIIFALVS